MLHGTAYSLLGEKFHMRIFWLIIISLAVVSIQINAQGWTNTTNLPTPRFGASASVVNGKIYVMGGEAAGGTWAGNEMYDPLTGMWEVKTPIPIPRVFLLTAVVNDTIYAIGGMLSDHSTYMLKVEAYDPITNTWTTKNNMQSGRIGQNAAVVDGIIYVEGGNFNSRELWAYNPSTDTWTQKQSIPAPGGGNSSLTVYNGLIYAIGGSTYSPWNALPYVFAYNPQTDTWIQKQNMPTARFGLQTYLVEGKIYAVGGGLYDNSAIATVQVYDPVADSWETLPDMPIGLVWFAGAFAYDTVYVFGGIPMGWGSIESKVWACHKLALPVELTSFTASANGKEVTLNWSTATELNNQGFEIQRKFGSNDFATIGSVKGNGTTTSPNQYSYVDKLVDEGRYFYRLKQIDYGGTFEYSSEIEVEVRVLDKFTLEQNYPNPFNPMTTIGYVLQEKNKIKLTLLNSIGEEIAVLVNEEQDKGFHQVEFNGTNLTSGVYFYQLIDGRFVETKKMILLR